MCSSGRKLPERWRARLRLLIQQRGTVVPTVDAFLRWGPTYHDCIAVAGLATIREPPETPNAARTLASPTTASDSTTWHGGPHRRCILAGLATIREPPRTPNVARTLASPTTVSDSTTYQGQSCN